MLNPFCQNDLTLLFRLIVAHILVDFLLQKNSLSEPQSKKSWTSSWLYIHGALAGILIYSFAGYWSAIWLPLVIFISHTLIDGFKSMSKDTIGAFLIDQLAHLIIIFICWILLIDIYTSYVIGFLISLLSNTEFWILVLAYSTVIWPAGIFISKSTVSWREQIEKSSTGLVSAGLWIGRLERILILTFILVKHFEAIGFLITAKSIFRFGEIQTAGNRKEPEYFIIGTMISFVIAIVLGLLTTWFLK